RRPRAPQKKGVIVPNVMMLFILRLGLKKATTPEKLLARLRMHIQMLTGNANFTTPEPTLPVLQAAADELEQAIDDVNSGNKAKIPHRNAVVAQVEEYIRTLSYYVQLTSNGDAEKIQSAGFELRKEPSAPQLPVQVANLRAEALGNGKIKLRWKAVSNADIYVVQASKDIYNFKEAIMDKTTRSSFVFENLEPGTMYYMKVFAINSVGDGNPSDVVEQRVL
ncbi:MAG: fibronectin type III domain-containing protein, partial [Bacteroidetes bacterium]|nr:fibronectin type III domain-containing protein [Bacteroidota bacterium]